MGHVIFNPQGRLGNFYMEAFTAWAYAKRNGMKFTVPFKTSSDFHSPIYSHHLQDFSYDESLPLITINEKHFHYAPLPFKEEWREKNVLLRGYFQSHKYWDEYRDEMLDAFKFEWKLQPDVCAIHARYGDYLTIRGKHIVVDEPYLKEAIKMMRGKTGITRFKVFSDDLPLFKHRHGNLYDFEYSTNNSIWDDFIEISCCASNINSSSTFSWIAAYINRNPDKVIITQREWLTRGWDNATFEDVIPPNWIKI